MECYETWVIILAFAALVPPLSALITCRCVWLGVVTDSCTAEVVLLLTMLIIPVVVCWHVYTRNSLALTLLAY
jgi:hypothetical protein